MMMIQQSFIETLKTISVSETRKKDLSNGVGPICLSQLVKKWQKCKDLQPSGKKKSLRKWLWGVPNWPPGEKSIWCRKFGDGVESGGRVGTLRWTPEVPQCLLHRLIGGLKGVKMAKNGKMVIFKKNPKFIDFFCLQCCPCASWTQETWKYKMGSQVMRGRP